MSQRRRGIAWSLLWIGAAFLYLAAAAAQKHRLNLSSTAGGQFPYLEYAAGMAVDGVTGHWGDRNRMPLYPALIRLAYHPDWPTFSEGASYLAIAITLVALAALGVLFRRLFSPLGAAVLTIYSAFGVFLPTASFVQADLLYYAVFLVAWVLLCQVLRRPDPRWGVAAGAMTGLAWLTKASALPALGAYLFVALSQAAARRWRPGRAVGSPALVATDAAGAGERSPRPSGGESREKASPPATPRRILITAAMTTMAFLLVVYPYITNSQARFGRYFYNVNSTFFIWCDKWPQAQAFMEKYRATEQFPDAPPGDIPSPMRYWRTHSLDDMAWRMGYGFKVLASLLWRSDYGKSLGVMIAVAAVCGAAAWRRGRAPAVPPAWAAFNMIMVAGYTLAYAWYVVVAYGDRFIASLAIPAACMAVWLVEGCAAGRGRDPHADGNKDENHRSTRHGSGERWGRLSSPRLGLRIVLAAVVVQAGVTLATRTLRPLPAFVRFYYIESYEQVRAGNDAEAVRGFRGAIRLDPTFAPAHRELGAAMLRAGRFEEAAASLGRAVELDPDLPDAHNSLGAALAQLGRLDEAIGAFQRAADLDPNLVSAWYNLAVLHLRAGDRPAFDNALAQLRRLDPALAQQLDEMLTQP